MKSVLFLALVSNLLTICPAFAEEYQQTECEKAGTASYFVIGKAQDAIEDDLEALRASQSLSVQEQVRKDKLERVLAGLSDASKFVLGRMNTKECQGK